MKPLELFEQVVRFMNNPTRNIPLLYHYEEVPNGDETNITLFVGTTNDWDFIFKQKCDNEGSKEEAKQLVYEMALERLLGIAYESVSEGKFKVQVILGESPFSKTV